MDKVDPPTSQRYRQIALALQDGTNPVKLFVLPVRPEDFTRTEPARVSAVNALGGAWVDSFGRGLTTIAISGNTGWRRSVNTKLDGAESFLELRDKVINAWHELRQKRIDVGLNPGEVRLILIDALNGAYVADVVPMSFVLRRSRSMPLLMNYTLSLTVANDKAVNPYSEDANTVNPEASLASALSSIKSIAEIQKSINKAQGAIGAFGKDVSKITSEVLGPAMTMAGDVMTTANATKSLITSSGAIVLGVAADLSTVGSTLWASVASVTSLPNTVRGQIMSIKKEFTNLHCVIKNGYEQAYQAVNYEDMYGASNCSSTAGGRPASVLAGTNPFAGSIAQNPITLTPTAQTGIAELKAVDIVAPISISDLGRNIRAVLGGVVFNA